MRNDFDYDRPSRLARGVILLSTIGVSMIAAWVFAPILLAKYAAQTDSVEAPASGDTAPDVVTIGHRNDHHLRFGAAAARNPERLIQRKDFFPGFDFQSVE